MKPRSIVLGLFFLATAAVVAAYSEGLSGQFLLDDIPALQGISRYLAGEASFGYAIGVNPSGPLGRGVSMLSLLLNAQLNGLEAPAFKATNLALHVLCGLLISAITRLLLMARNVPAQTAFAAALICGALWMSLAIHVSTVLYVVQRMSQLSAIFVLAALICYTVWRAKLAPCRRGDWALLGAIFPLAALAAFSKENGVLVFPLIAVLEFTVFRDHSGQRKQISAVLVVLTVLLPLLLLAWFLLARPDWLVNSYSIRSFSLLDRLLTQPHVLLSYLRQIVAPDAASLGLFHDDFPISRGPFSLPTLASLCGLLALGCIAFFSRARKPIIAAGIGIFLVAHSVESSFIPLEMYFEHRNYLAAFGVILAVIGACLEIYERYPSRNLKLIFVMTFVAITAANTLLVRSQARTWQSRLALFEHGAISSPKSPRVQMMLLGEYGSTGAWALVDEQAVKISARFPNEEIATELYRLQLRCDGGQSVTPERLDAAISRRAGATVDIDIGESFAAVAERVLDERCPGLTTTMVAGWGQKILNRPQHSAPKKSLAKVEYFTAKLLATAGNPILALPYADAAWRSDQATAIAILRFQLNATLGRRQECRTILEDIKRSNVMEERAATAAIALFEEWLRNPPAP